MTTSVSDLKLCAISTSQDTNINTKHQRVEDISDAKCENNSSPWHPNPNKQPLVRSRTRLHLWHKQTSLVATTFLLQCHKPTLDANVTNQLVGNNTRLNAGSSEAMNQSSLELTDSHTT